MDPRHQVDRLNQEDLELGDQVAQAAPGGLVGKYIGLLEGIIG